VNKKRRIKSRLLRILKPIKWFYPGMGVKRWILFSSIGIILLVAGGQFLADPRTSFRIVGITHMFFGIVVIGWGMRRVLLAFITVLLPEREKELVDIFFQKRRLERGYRIVCMGGGTGLATLLHGLKAYTNNITAIVTVADEGGSSGKLRKDFNVLPPGDIRNCLVALADTEALMGELFQYRFDGNTAFAGHSFGNIFILAMTKVTKDFAEAVKQSSKILAIRGQVVPSTLKKIRLLAELEDGTTTIGEIQISERDNPSPIKKISLIPSDCVPTSAALEAIRNADAIVLGPGSLYTSVIPNLLVNSMSEAINDSPAIKMYVCNVMTQHGETDDYKASDHLINIFKNTGLDKIDYFLVNNAAVPKNLANRYAEEKATQVVADLNKIRESDTVILEDNFISTRDYVRHDSKRVANAIIDCISIAKSEAAHAT